MRAEANSRRLRGAVRVARALCALVLMSLAIPALSSAQPEPDYVIGPQDVISITVWEQADLTGKFAVEADGTFTFPLIGRVKAGGLTLKQLEAEVIRRLKDGFFINPQVTVAIEQYRSQRIFVMGEVRTPGPQSLTGEMTLVAALASAGSTLPTAGDEAIVVRPPEGSAVAVPVDGDPSTTSIAVPDGATPSSERRHVGSDVVIAQARAVHAQVIRVDIRDLQRGVIAQNIRLRDGDTVFVPRAPTIFVFGQVQKPGEYPVKSETTVLQALSLAGGVTDRGATGRIKVVRLVNGDKKEVDVHLNDLVRPGDTVVVPERFF